MRKKYEYKGIIYSSERDVRKALFEKQRIVLGKTPDENATAFWLNHQVVYTEEDEPIEFYKDWKYVAIKNAFLAWRNNQATLTSSLGFRVDSNERAMSDVSALLIAYEDSQDTLITFRDADNAFHSLTYAQVKTLQKEIIENGSYAYAQKWALDAQVEDSTTREELDAIVVNFLGKDYTKE